MANNKAGRWYEDPYNVATDDYAPGAVSASGNSPVFSAEEAIALEATLVASGASGGTPNVTIKLQGSLDGTNWNDVPGGAFPAQSGAQAGYGIVAGPLPPSLRWNIAYTGTGSLNGVAISTKRRFRA